MTRKRRHWGLLGLLGGLGGLVMLGAKNTIGDLPLEPVEPAEPTPEPTPTPPREPKHIHKPEGPTPEPTPTPPREPKHIHKPEGPTPEPTPTPTPPREPKHIHKPEGPTPEPDPPFVEIIAQYPRGGRFYQVVLNDRFGGTSSKHSIAYRYLLSEAYLAATEGGLEHEDAIAWALAIAKQDKLRVRIIDLIQCSGWNDAMYGTLPVQQSHASPQGRSIRLTPIHGPTLELLGDDLPPFRNATMKGNPAEGEHREYELLWLPSIDRDLLWESSEITTTGMVWDDGTSMENPPPWVMALGIDDHSGALVGDFGCPGSDGELEIG